MAEEGKVFDKRVAVDDQLHFVVQGFRQYGPIVSVDISTSSGFSGEILLGPAEARDLGLALIDAANAADK